MTANINEYLRADVMGVAVKVIGEDIPDLTVVAVDRNREGYDWDQVAVYHSKSKRRWYAIYDSGCSCNDFGDRLRVGDYHSGSKQETIRYLDSLWGSYENAKYETIQYRPR